MATAVLSYEVLWGNNLIENKPSVLNIYTAGVSGGDCPSEANSDRGHPITKTGTRGLEDISSEPQPDEGGSELRGCTARAPGLSRR